MSTPPRIINPDRWWITAGELKDAAAHAELLGEQVTINSRQAYKLATVVSRRDAPGFWLLLALADQNFDHLRDAANDERYEALYVSRETAAELLVSVVKALGQVTGDKPSAIVQAMLEGVLADEKDDPPG